MCRSLLVLAGGAIVLALSACAPVVTLTPAPSATLVPGTTNEAVASAKGIRMVVVGNAWVGEEGVLDYVTPVRVTIEDDTTMPLRVQYRQFALVGQKGDLYAALPPFDIKGTITEPILGQAYSPILTPDFDYDRFLVAPPYTRLYPRIGLWGDPFFYDPDYYDTYWNFWASIPLPTDRMLVRALPEGVIQPGGRVTGFLYFKRVSPSDKLVRFRADLVDAAGRQTFGEISIPFVVRR